MYLFFILSYPVLLTVICIWAKKSERAVLNNISLESDFNGAQALWAIREAMYNNIERTKVAYLVLHNITFVLTGPITDLSSLKFLGTSNSYSLMDNDGSLGGNEAVTWLFYINPDFKQDSVIMQYEGDINGPGMQIRITSDDLICVRLFSCNVYCVHEDFCSSRVKAMAGSWTFLGITYNRLWPSDNMDITDLVEADRLQIDPTKLRATGKIRFGSSWNGTEPLTGLISCIQYFNKSLQGKVLRNVENECDPALWSIPDYDDPVVDSEFYSLQTTTPTTRMTTENVDNYLTNDQGVDSEFSSLQTTIPTTRTTTENVHNHLTETVSFEPVVNRCMEFEKIAENKSIQPFKTDEVSRLIDCARLCINDSECKAFSINLNLKICRLSRNVSLISDTDFKVFVLK